MVTIHLDGERLVVAEGSTLGSIIKGHPPGCAVAIIRPATQEQAKTGSLAISTTAGQITVELTGEHASFLESPAIVPQLALHWAGPLCGSLRAVSLRSASRRENPTCTSGAMSSSAAGVRPGAVIPACSQRAGIRPTTGLTRAGALSGRLSAAWGCSTAGRPVTG